jgi:hypothetical protein
MDNILDEGQKNIVTTTEENNNFKMKRQIDNKLT